MYTVIVRPIITNAASVEAASNCPKQLLQKIAYMKKKRKLCTTTHTAALTTKSKTRTNEKAYSQAHKLFQYYPMTLSTSSLNLCFSIKIQKNGRSYSFRQRPINTFSRNSYALFNTYKNHTNAVQYKIAYPILKIYEIIT